MCYAHLSIYFSELSLSLSLCLSPSLSFSVGTSNNSMGSEISSDEGPSRLNDESVRGVRVLCFSLSSSFYLFLSL